MRVPELLRELQSRFPRGPGGAVAMGKILLKAGLGRAEALRLAQALDPRGAMGAERMRTYADRRPTPEEIRAVEEALAEPAARAALGELAQNPPRLALAMGERLLGEPGPPPRAPSLPVPGFDPPEEAGVYLVAGLPFREGFRLGMLLGEYLAHRRGLEGVFLGAQTQAGTARLARVLEERWGAFSQRSGRLPYLPGEARSWIEGPGAALQGAFVAGTVDHALRAVLPVPEAPLRLALLMRKVTVLALPEEPFLFAHLVTWLEWTRALSRPAVLVAPWAPRFLRADLARAAGFPEVPQADGPALIHWGEGGCRVWPLPLARPPGQLRVGPPEAGDAAWLFASRERAVAAYRAHTRGSSRARAPFVHRVVDGRRVVLLHGGIPLGERREREAAEAEMQVGTWTTAAEGLAGERVYLEDPTPWLLAALRLSCAEVKAGFSPSAPRFYPEAVFSLARRMVRGEDPDPYALPEVQEWWNAHYQKGRSQAVAPQSFPRPLYREARLRRGARTLLLLPPSGLADSAYQLEPLAQHRPDLLRQEEWVAYISSPVPRETGVT